MDVVWAPILLNVALFGDSVEDCPYFNAGVLNTLALLTL